MWYKYKIDYSYGVADMYVRDDDLTNSEAEDLFYDLASQCFGIRKSIGATEVFGPNELDDEQLNEIRFNLPSSFEGDVFNAIFKGHRPKDHVTQTVDKTAKYVLAHSGGDIIVWSDKDTKIVTEWDGVE